ncbi:MAG TPA: hypothetical protein PLJ37_00980 [Chitinophagales bacterium]|nr:hypothetical protein [Chitinophagales bacterium]HMW93401.1 hypothetical protein [Chitinophagales bacterium]HMZ92977.1 hypothetical protein [Chitinophagales bacterium]HNG25960.1 hypothetical protein [Chitinophagales bacterium]
MINKFKIGISFLLIVSLLVGIYFFKIYKKKVNQYQELQSKYYQISSYTAQLESQYLKDDDFKKRIQEDFNDSKSLLFDKNNLIIEPHFKLPNKTRFNKTFDFQNDRYYFHEIHLNEGSSVDDLGPPIGYVMIKKNGEVVSKIYNHEIIIDSLVSEDSKTSKIQVISKGYLKLLQSGLANRKDSKQKNWKNIKYPINIVNGEVLVNSDNQFQKKHLMFNVKGDLGVAITSSIDNLHVLVSPNIGVSLLSYGKSKKDNLFRFIRVGVGITSDKTFYSSVSPIMFNVGYKTNVFSNTYLYPTFGYSLKNKFNIGLGLSLSF